MPFISNGTTIISFAEYQDVLDQDQRLFEANEGLTDDVIESMLARSTDRILSLMRATDWWRDLYLQKTTNPQLNTRADVPVINPNKIIARQDDFTELCVQFALWNYILPKVADFSKEDNAERAKIGFYQGKYQFLFEELINSGDWYDLDGSGTVDSSEKFPGQYVQKRIR
jgi:hypothetical protein